MSQDIKHVTCTRPKEGKAHQHWPAPEQHGKASSADPMVRRTLRPIHPVDATARILQVPRIPESRNLATRVVGPPAHSSHLPVALPTKAAPALYLTLQHSRSVRCLAPSKPRKQIKPYTLATRSRLIQKPATCKHPAPHHPRSSASRPL